MSVKRAMLWLMLIAMCATIFAFSSQTGDESHRVSERYAVPLMRLIQPLMKNASAEEMRQALGTVELIIRKFGHFSEYAVLGLLAFLLAKDYLLRRPGLCAWGFSTVYAVTDELHQLMSAGRSGMWQDVVLDSFGSAAGILLMAFLMNKHRCKGKKTVCE